jgi:uncharacterized protein (DUF58 family)
MSVIKKYIGDLFLTTRFFLALGFCIILFIFSFFFPVLLQLPLVVLLSLAALIFFDYIFLFIAGKAPSAKRIMPERLSNGDENKIELQIKNYMPFVVDMEIIDELPVQFQKRDWVLIHRFKANEQKNIVYTLRPIERGEYNFGRILLYVKSLLGLLMRRHAIPAQEKVGVFPSFVQLRKYELLSQTTIQSEQGNKRMRKIGHSMEFEQIKEYVQGDDIRTINWKATGRKGIFNGK